MIDEITYNEIKAAIKDNLNSLQISEEFALSLEETNNIIAANSYEKYSENLDNYSVTKSPRRIKEVTDVDSTTFLNPRIEIKIENILFQVGAITDKLAKRAEKIDFSAKMLSASDAKDLGMYLAYTKNFADIAKVRLFYHRSEIVPKS